MIAKELNVTGAELNVIETGLTLTQRAAIGFTAGVIGAVAVVVFSQILSQLGIVAKGPIPFPLRFKPPGIYQPLFWGGLWGILFALFAKPDLKGFYLLGFLYVLAPMLATFLFFLPRGGAGYFGLEKAGPAFPLYVLLVNLPFGITVALVTKAITNQSGISQHAAIGFAAGVIGAAAVVLLSHILFGLGVSEALGVKAPVSLKSPDIYKPLFWGGLWGILFGAFIKTAWNHLYVIGFLFVLAPLLALFLFFLPKANAGFFGLKMGPMFTLYLVLVNLPFGIVTALAAKAMIGKAP